MSNIIIHSQNFKTMKKIFLLFSFISVFTGFSQKAGDKKLAEAIQVFQEANDITGMIASITLFREAVDRSNSWIPAYWTSFAYSQTGRISENPPMYYDSAQYYLDKVIAKNGLSEKEQADVHVLQSLIYGLRAGGFWSKGDRENGMKYSNLDSEALSKAIQLDIENPRIYLLSATGIISDGLRNQDAGYILAGGQMLEIAKAKYEANKPSNELYPDWGKGWINFWIQRAKIGD